jgi:hypothetical protein
MTRAGDDAVGALPGCAGPHPLAGDGAYER